MARNSMGTWFCLDYGPLSTQNDTTIAQKDRPAGNMSAITPFEPPSTGRYSRLFAMTGKPKPEPLSLL